MIDKPVRDFYRAADKLIHDFFRPNITYGLVGESGTGKSHQSKFVAARYKITYIIDDGLLIKDEHILAGRSAKEEQTFLAAVKVAIFSDKDRRDEVARKLLADNRRKVLILGTSEKMVYKIAVRLQLPLPKRIIKIEDFSKPHEIDTALRTRRVEGKHIIPLPAVEVRKAYSDIFLTSQPVFKGKVPRTIGFIPESHEKSLVRPVYSTKPKIHISDFSLSLIVKNEVNGFDPRIKIKKIDVIDEANGYTLIMTIDIPFGLRLEKKIDELKQYITENIERFSGILIENVNILIDKVIEIV
jgi:ABC-type dipeptide/oligopeptide/nickel transport system ATPase component